MSILDNITRQKIEDKVDVVFKEIRSAKTPEEVVPLLVELSEFIDDENLTMDQLEEIKGLGWKAMKRHSRMEFLNNLGALISIVMSSMIGGATITAIYYLITSGIASLESVLLVPIALLPIYLLYYGKTQKWFN